MEMHDHALALATAVDSLSFTAPVHTVYNPLHYAWQAHKEYIERYACGAKEIVFWGMNPGPWGMAQTGVPFGEISYVRDWLKIETAIQKPLNPHPKRPVEGFACQRSEVSGRRLWGLFKEKFGSAESFFKKHFVANYCPLVFMEESGRNFTPDKLGVAPEAVKLFEYCDQHVRAVVNALRPKWVIGVGGFAEKQLKRALHATDVRVGAILHPSPASPKANRNWAGFATEEMEKLGLW